MDRQDKIQFLKDFSAGKREMWRLLPPKFLEFKVYKSRPGVEVYDGREITVDEANAIRQQGVKEREMGRVVFIEVCTYD